MRSTQLSPSTRPPCPVRWSAQAYPSCHGARRSDRMAAPTNGSCVKSDALIGSERPPSGGLFVCSSHPRRDVACRCSDPQEIDNLRNVAGRGIIRDGLAATRTIDRQLPAWHSGEMDRRRSRDLQHPMFRREVRSTHGRRPAGHPAPRFALVDDRLTTRLQGMWCCRFCEHRAELA
jgi:hypothetical protein